ncbi:hypothetical protein [uncultured Helicobacter sp.]|uniref:hypothetical protein n=1 Tax=uncultured Helicobacter sp. TaxID=175537 RepID=UPI00374F0387
MYGRVSGASGDLLSTSDTNLPQANCNKIIESITTSDITESTQSQDSKKGSIWSRSTAVRGFTSNPDSNLLKNKIEMDSINSQTFAFGGGQITHYRDSLY